jgi:hypothetical protein
MNPRACITRALALLALLACRPETARACAACFGKSDSALAKGMNWGIFTLLFFIVSVLAGLSCFFVFLAVRSSRHPQSGPTDGPPDPSQNS